MRFATGYETLLRMRYARRSPRRSPTEGSGRCHLTSAARNWLSLTHGFRNGFIMNLGRLHGEQASRGVWNAQLLNLVWSSNLEIEPRELIVAPWPWRSQEEFTGRLRSAVTRLYKRARFRPKPVIPFRPEEERFLVAWIQETCEMRVGEEPRPALDLVKAHVPETGHKNCLGLDPSEWFKFRGIEFAWLKAKGVHELAVAGGPPPDGPIVYPWTDKADFEGRVEDAERINQQLPGIQCVR